MDLVVWLRSLGLEQYEAAFRENAIDDKVLPKLTAEDLKDIRVNIVGHRRKLSTPSPPCALTRARKHHRPIPFRQPT